MKAIDLPGGKQAIVDDEDYAGLLARSWHLQAGCGTFYAVTNMPRPGGGYSTVGMHRLINNTPPGMHTDHIDGDGLNNTRANLRTATRQQNMRNRKPNAASTSSLKGVYWRANRRRWLASIRVDGKLKLLGMFKDEAEAGRAYDAAAREHFGEFARTNGGTP